MRSIAAWFCTKFWCVVYQFAVAGCDSVWDTFNLSAVPSAGFLREKGEEGEYLTTEHTESTEDNLIKLYAETSDNQICVRKIDVFGQTEQ